MLITIQGKENSIPNTFQQKYMTSYGVGNSSVSEQCWATAHIGIGVYGQNDRILKTYANVGIKLDQNGV